MVIGLAFAFGWGLGATQPTPYRAPPPPPPIYDPLPGPFLAPVDSAGRVTDATAGVLESATRSWSGERLSAFRLCIDDQAHIADHFALERVAAALVERGAAVVLIDADRRCAGPSRQRRPHEPIVQVTGLIRPRTPPD